MRCPECGDRELRINVVLAGEVQFRFHDDQTVEPRETGDLDSFWGPEAECRCPRCEWSGLAIMAADAEDDFLRMMPYAEHEMARLERYLESGNCPPPLVPRIQDLLASVSQQTEILRSLHRTIAAQPRSPLSMEGRATPP